MRSTLVLVALLASLIPQASPTAQAPTLFSPVGAQTGPGGRNNNYPFSWRGGAYQQVHSASSFTSNAPATLNRLRFRMGEGFIGRAGNTVDLELFVGDSPNDATNASTTFANNVVPGSEVNVVTRKNVNLPTLTNDQWDIIFPFDTPFAWSGGHLEWRAVVWGNGNNNQSFTYPIDAFSSQGTSTRIGSTTGCQSALATRAASHSASLAEPGQLATFTGNSYYTPGGLPSVLTLGDDDQFWLGLPLPFDLGVVGAPQCFVTNNILLTRNNTTNAGTNGNVRDSFVIPDDATLSGLSFFSQHMFLQPGANSLGLFTTDGRENTVGAPQGLTRIFSLGNQTATSGSRSREFGLSIGFN